MTIFLSIPYLSFFRVLFAKISILSCITACKIFPKVILINAEHALRINLLFIIFHSVIKFSQAFYLSVSMPVRKIIYS